MEAATLKAAAEGRWKEVLSHVGIDANLLDGGHHPCPKCGGSDRFRMLNEQCGAVICNQCFSERNGDGLAAIGWLTGQSFPESIQTVSEILGINGSRELTSQLDIVERIAREKRIPIESFRGFGAATAQRTGKHGDFEVCRVPMFGPDLQPCSSFDMWPSNGPQTSKGLNEKGKKPGLFIHSEWKPVPGETVYLVEGVKDAAALHSIGFPTVGLPHSQLSAKFAHLFREMNVVLLPDRDKAGQKGAKKSASILAGIVSSVSIAHLPSPLQDSGGDGIREILNQADGTDKISTAIQNAIEWQPEVTPSTELTADTQSGSDFIPDITTKEGQTDLANARRFARKFSGRMIYCFPWKKWLIWDGRRWNIDDSGQIYRFAQEIADDNWREAREGGSGQLAIQHAANSASSRGIEAMLKLARSMVAVDYRKFDSDNMLFNCPNGTIDLQTGELRPHNPNDFITKLCPTRFNPNAQTYVIDRFVEAIWPNQSLVTYCQRFLGMCLTGDIREQAIWIFHGIGSNGKSVVINGVLETMGSDYAIQAVPDLLMQKGDRHPTELADLHGIRLAVCTEIDEGRSFAEAKLKALTGGDRIRARRMKEDFWEFAPTHKLILCTNHKPTVKNQDHAIWRRLKLVPFDQTFWDADKGESGPDDMKADKTLPAKLRASSEGFLAWLVQGCLDWKGQGLGRCEAIEEATSGYRSESDVMGRFVAENCISMDGIRVKFNDLWESFQSWTDESGDELPSKKRFGTWLHERGYEKKRSGGIWYLGIQLKVEE